MSSYQKTYVGAYLEIETRYRLTTKKGHACGRCHYSANLFDKFCKKCGGHIVEVTSTQTNPARYLDVIEDAYEEFSDELVRVASPGGKLVLIGNMEHSGNADCFDDDSRVCEMTPEIRMQYITAFSQNYEKVLKYISSLVASGKVTSMQLKFGAVIYYE